MVTPVQGGEPFEITGGPGVFPLKELVDFSLRGGAAADGLLVGFFGGTNLGAGIADVCLWWVGCLLA